MQQTLKRYVEKIFFSNVFLGFIVVALCIDNNLEQGFLINSVWFYAFVFSITILFYLHAYRNSDQNKFIANPRMQFYFDYRQSVGLFYRFLLLSSIVSGVVLALNSVENLAHLPFWVYVMLGISVLLSFAYYDTPLQFSFRRLMWFKPILIAWTWTMVTSILPLVFLTLEQNQSWRLDARFVFISTQIFMFCLVNALLFDVKDYEDDANHQLKTFVVQYGEKIMVYRVIIPLLFLGAMSLIVFGVWYDLPLHRVIFMLMPIVIFALLSLRLNANKSILYFLVVIDGMLLLKALLGIFCVFWFE